MKLDWTVVVCVGLAVGMGCSSGAGLTGAGGQSGGAGLTGAAGGQPSGGGSGGRAEWASFVGRRSFVVTWTVTQSTPGSSVGTPLVSPHPFTMVVDADAGSAFVGDGGGASACAFTRPSPSELAFAGPVSFSGQSGIDAWSISYKEMTLQLGADDRLTGTARGTALTWRVGNDTGTTWNVTVKLAGEPDKMPPSLTATTSRDLDDPLMALTVTASEPLLPDARPALRDDDGSLTLLTPRPATNPGFVTAFDGPVTTLRYGHTYRIVADGVTDFAGLPATSVPFTTRAPPPLVPEDGFESATDPMLGGAQIVTSAEAPTISGTRSLFIPGYGAGLQQTRPSFTRLALRLAVTPGDTVIRFSYRVVDLNGPLTIHVVREGGTRRSADIGRDQVATTTTTVAGLPNRAVGPLATAEIPLPADAGSEVIFAEILPAIIFGSSYASGLIIDDLRVE